MYAAAVWLLCIVVVVDCATAGRLLPWPVLVVTGFLVRGASDLWIGLTR
jgi:hypothetical protein